MFARNHFILSIFIVFAITVSGTTLMAMLPPEWPGGPPCVRPGDAQTTLTLAPGAEVEVAAGTSKRKKGFVAVYGEGVEVTVSGDIRRLKCRPEVPDTTVCTFIGTGRRDLTGPERRYGTVYITLSGVTEPTDVKLLTQIP